MAIDENRNIEMSCLNDEMVARSLATLLVPDIANRQLILNWLVGVLIDVIAKRIQTGALREEVSSKSWYNY